MKSWGIIGRNGWERTLRQLSGINVNRGLLHRIFGTGQIWVEPSGGARENLVAVYNPKEFQQAIIDGILA